METFSEWLVRELRVRNMSPAELSRTSGITQSALSRLISGSRKPNTDTIQAIAKGLKVNVEEIYEVCGILQHKSTIDDILTNRILEMVKGLQEDDKEDILSLIQAKIDRQNRKSS